MTGKGKRFQEKLPQRIRLKRRNPRLQKNINKKVNPKVNKSGIQMLEQVNQIPVRSIICPVITILGLTKDNTL